MDGAAKYCLESRCVVLDVESIPSNTVNVPRTKTRHPVASEMKRAIQYFDKGFDLILPVLDMKKLPRRNLDFGLPEVLDLPKLTVAYESVEGNKIPADWLPVSKER
jgi:hypothetical protein